MSENEKKLIRKWTNKIKMYNKSVDRIAKELLQLIEASEGERSKQLIFRIGNKIN